MVVPNVYSTMEREREQILRALSLFATLFGGGLNFAYFTLYVAQGDLGPVYPIGLAVVTVLALAFTVFIWIEPHWRTDHSLASFLVGALWVLIGFYTINSDTLDAYGAIQTIMGGVLMGVGMAGVAGLRFTVRKKTATRTLRRAAKPR